MAKLYVLCIACDGSGLGTTGPDSISCATCHGEGYVPEMFTREYVLRLRDERDRYRNEVDKLAAIVLRISHLPGQEREASDG